MEKIKKYFSLRLPAKASMWYIASSVVARGIGALSTPIFTRLLSAAEYGVYPLYLSWLTVASVIVSLELSGGAIYRGLQKYGDRKDEFLSSAFGLFLTVFIGFCALYFSFSYFINSLTGLSTFITTLMLVEIFANTVIGFYTAKARFEYRYKSVSALSLISALSSVLLSVVIILLSDAKGEARIIGSVIALCATGTYALFMLLKNSKGIYSKEVWLFLLKVNVPLLPHYFSISLIMRIGEIAVAKGFGKEALGKYSVAVSLGMALTIITSGILSALSPWIIRKIKAKETENIRELLLLITKALCLICLLLLSCAPELLAILTPPDFHSVLPVVYPIAISVIPIFLSNALTSAEMYFEKSILTAIPSVITATVSVLLTLSILPRVDYRFVGLFVLFAYSLLTLLNVLVYKQISGQNPIHVKPTLVSILLTALYSVILFIFRDVMLSRIILALPLLPVLFILGKQAYGKIKEI